jgi:hypothetical protein
LGKKEIQAPAQAVYQSSIHNSGISSASRSQAKEVNIRFKDYIPLLGVSLGTGLFLSVICFSIWTDAYESTANSFWFSWFGFGVLSLPIGYWAAKWNSTCPQCSKPFVLSEDGQTDIENFVKYKNESVTENGVTRRKDVPYNVRRYYQHMKCDSCQYEYKFETKCESRA